MVCVQKFRESLDYSILCDAEVELWTHLLMSSFKLCLLLFLRQLRLFGFLMNSNSASLCRNVNSFGVIELIVNEIFNRLEPK